MALPGRTAGEIAAHLSGRVVGDGSVIPTAFCGVDNIEDGALVCIDDKKHLPAVLASGARVLVASEELASGRTEIIVADAKAAFYRLLDSFYPESDLPPCVSPKAVIAAGVNIPASVRIEENVVIRAAAVIGEGCIIQANAVVGEGCVLGENTRLYPNVTLYRRTVIGKNVIIHSGTVIGGDGFGYRVAPGGVREKIPQKGSVSIGDDVEIGANVTIDRSTLGPTIISNGVKIDNLVQVAHNCFIGENTVLVAQVGVAGSTRIGRNCIIAGQVGIADHCDIGDDVIIGAQGGVMSNVKIPPRSVYWGSPAQDMKDEKLAKLGSRKLYALVKFVEEKFSVKL